MVVRGRFSWNLSCLGFLVSCGFEVCGGFDGFVGELGGFVVGVCVFVWMYCCRCCGWDCLCGL